MKDKKMNIRKTFLLSCLLIGTAVPSGLFADDAKSNFNTAVDSLVKRLTTIKDDLKNRNKTIVDFKTALEDKTNGDLTKLFMDFGEKYKAWKKASEAKPEMDILSDNFINNLKVANIKIVEENLHNYTIKSAGDSQTVAFEKLRKKIDTFDKPDSYKRSEWKKFTKKLDELADYGV